MEYKNPIFRLTYSNHLNFQRRQDRRCSYRRRMQTIIKDRKVQHIEGDKISRKQKIFLQILKILKAVYGCCINVKNKKN